MKKILITGGAGFIGSHLTRRLVNAGYSVRVIDNLERGSLENIIDVLNKISFIEADLRNYDNIEKLFAENFDIIIHLASKVGGIGVYTSQPYEIMSNNMLIDMNVLKATLKHNINQYIYASSAHVYPKQLQELIKSPKIEEESAYPADAELSYGWAKLIGEKQIEYAALENPKFHAVMARFIGIYGTGQDYNLETGSVIPVFSHRAIKYPEIPFKILSGGKETRSYCYIDDVLDCMELMINKFDETKLVTVNIGKEERESILEIAKKIIKISNKDISIDIGASKDTLIWGQWCSCKRAKEIYGWEATTSLEDGLKVVYNDIKNRLK